MRKQWILLLLALSLVLIASGPRAMRRAVAMMNEREDGQSLPAHPPAFLTGPNPGDAVEIALVYLRQNAPALGLTLADLEDLVVRDHYTSSFNGVTHLYFRQRHQGIEVDNGDLNVNVASNGAVISVGNRFVSNLAAKINTVAPAYTAIAAAGQAAQYLRLPVTEPFRVLYERDGPAPEVTVSDGGIAKEPISLKLMFLRQPNDVVRLAWRALIHTREGNHAWKVGVDAENGALIDKVDIILHHKGDRKAAATLQDDPAPPDDDVAADASEPMAKQPASPLTTPTYRVFALPLEHPDDGPGLPTSQTLLRNPADSLASPYGWHDIDGRPGHEFNDTRGNNVFAQEDRNGDDLDGFRPTGRRPRRFNFDYAFDATLDPAAGENLQAALVNLFYWNNILHDVTYRYGFDEVSGNFQMNNYERGGFGADAVQADAHDMYDWGARNNAYFMPTADGEPPRMGMFVWDYTWPNRDSDLDNGIIIHEYAHGVSTRLVGGPSNPYCIFNPEQMGEGWSDWFTLALTAKPTDTGDRTRGLGAYVLGQPLDGPGIRQYPYSTNMAVNPLTYGSIRQNPDIYFVGQVWASMLWDLHWALVDQVGYDADLYTGNGGNNIALRLVIDGMKFMPCEPGFVDARNAILTADMVDYGGANQCTIWQAFAKRGLGYGADQGSPYSTVDGREAFDLPPSCRDDLSLVKTGTPLRVEAGAVLTYELTINNYTAQTLTGLTLTDPIPANTTYLPGSASEGGVEVDGVVTWQLPDLNPDEMTSRTFAVTVHRDYPDAIETFFDDMESGPQNWVAEGLWNWLDDSEPCGNSFSPTHSWYFGDTSTCTYPDDTVGRLTSATPLLLPSGKVTLSFASWENIEPCCEQRLVSVSTDGANFTPVWSSANNSSAWYTANVDLSAYAGQAVWVRFEFTSDLSVFYTGWYVDDVRIISEPSLVNVATLTSNEGVTAAGSAVNGVVKLPHIAVAPSSFEETLRLGERIERTLLVTNTGTAPLRYMVITRPPDEPSPISPTAGSMAPLPPAANAPAQAAPAQPSTAVAYDGERPAQARAEFVAAAKLGGLSAEQPPNVLLLAAADVYQLQALLDAYPDIGQVDIYDARIDTPLLEQLLAYETVVVVANNAFAEPAAVGDLLADYVDSGGTVVQTVPTFYDPSESGWGLRGRWLTDGYSPLIGVGDWFSFATLGEFDATHPIMQGVDEAGDYLRQVVELAPDADLVASWTDDEFVATRGGVVALNTFLADWYEWTGDVDLIVHNSIVWLQGQRGEPVAWLSVTPAEGLAAPDETQALQVTIDASVPGLVHGDYSAIIRILSNDPQLRRLDLPVTLHAVGPTLRLGDESPTWYGRRVQTPIFFTANGFDIAAATFSVDFDESCLRFNPADDDGDGIPDAIQFNLPPDFQGSASVDLGDADGELDFFIADLAPPFAALPDGPLATVELVATCLPKESPLIVGVAFSTEPAATASDPGGVAVAVATTPGSVAIQPGLLGDCNQDGAVNAGDTIACVLEIFDGDGSFWLDAPGGDYPGSPQGCDSNRDEQIDAADIVCTVLIIFQGNDACGSPVDGVRASQAVAAMLRIADGVTAAPGATVALPIELSTGGNPIAAAAFTIAYDPALLHVDLHDANGDGAPDGLVFNTPAEFVRSVTVPEPGRIQVVLADMALPLANLPDGALATLTVTADAAANGQTAVVAFAHDPAPSLGSSQGVRVPLVSTDGALLITAPEDTAPEDDTPDEVEEEPEVHEDREEDLNGPIYLPLIGG